MGRGGGLVVIVLDFHSNDPSLNPAEAYTFPANCGLKRMKINKKRPLGPWSWSSGQFAHLILRQFEFKSR